MIRDLIQQVKYTLLIIAIMLLVTLGILSMSLKAIGWTLVGTVVLGSWIEARKIVNKQNREAQNGN